MYSRISYGGVHLTMDTRHLRTVASSARLAALSALLPFIVGTESPAQEAGNDASSSNYELVVELGEELGPEQYTFVLIADIEVAPNGDILVLDMGDATVKRYDSKGRFLCAFGREGAGPGEFVRPTRLSVDSLINVYDSSQNRVSTFGFDCRHRETTRIPSSQGLNLRATFALRGGTVVGATSTRYELGSELNDPFVEVVAFRPGTAGIDTLITYHSGSTIWHAHGKRLPWGLTGADFGPGGAWAVHGDSLIVVADGYEGWVKWYRAGVRGLILIKQANIPLQSRPISEEDLKDLKAHFQRYREEIGQPVGDVDLIAPPRWSVASYAFFSREGDLWLRPGPWADFADTNSREMFLVFYHEDKETSEVVLPAGFRLVAVSGNRLYGVSRTELEVGIVRVYRLTR